MTDAPPFVTVPRVLVLLIVVGGVVALLGGFAWASRGLPASDAERSESWTKFPFGGGSAGGM